MSSRPSDRAVLQELKARGPVHTVHLLNRLRGRADCTVEIGRGWNNSLRAVRTTCDQLVRRGLAARDGYAGNCAVMWKITEAGRAWLLAHETADAMKSGAE